jgi:2-oxoglutarate ferredoxin oxidoreductase subunit delta
MPVTDIIIDSKLCKGCKLCIHVCPQDVFELSSERSEGGYLMPAAVRPEDCIECGSCELICPDLALTVEVASPCAEK